MAKRRARKPPRNRPNRRRPAVPGKLSKAARKAPVRAPRARRRKPSADHQVPARSSVPKRKKAKPSKKAVPVPRAEKRKTASTGRTKKRKTASTGRTKKQEKRVTVSARSFAAKKGWLTRRYNQLVKAVQERYERRDKEFQRELRKQAKTLAAKEKVIVYTQEQLRERGQAVERELKKAKAESDREFSRKLAIMERLWQAQLEGDFDDVAYVLAEEYDMDPREVYTLWHYNGGVD